MSVGFIEFLKKLFLGSIRGKMYILIIEILFVVFGIFITVDTVARLYNF